MTKISNNDSIKNKFQEIAVDFLYSSNRVAYNDRITSIGKVCACIIEDIAVDGVLENVSRESFAKKYEASDDTVKKGVLALMRGGYIERYDVISHIKQPADQPLVRDLKEYTLVANDKLIQAFKAKGVTFDFDADDLPEIHNKAIRIHNSIIIPERKYNKECKQRDLIPEREVVKQKKVKYPTGVAILLDRARKNIADFYNLVSDEDIELIKSGNILGTRVVLGKIEEQLVHLAELNSTLPDCKFKEEVYESIDDALISIDRIKDIVNLFTKDTEPEVLLGIIERLY